VEQARDEFDQGTEKARTSNVPIQLQLQPIVSFHTRGARNGPRTEGKDASPLPPRP
jgi:hypothetical protein